MAFTDIDAPGKHHQVALWSGQNDHGDSNTQTVTFDRENVSMQPDIFFTKSRVSVEGDRNGGWYDTSRGIGTGSNPQLVTATTAEDNITQGISQANSNGFGIGSNSNYRLNLHNSTYVGWHWKLNSGTTSSNTDGDITSTVQVNSTTKMGLCTYTGNGSDNQTIGHGLGVRPNFLYIRCRSHTSDGIWWQEGITWNHNKRLVFNGGYNAESDSCNGRASATASNSRGTSSIFTVFSGNSRFDNCNENNKTYIAWYGADVPGYSKYGHYKGNGSDDGPLVYLGFKPATVYVWNTGNQYQHVHNHKTAPNNCSADMRRLSWGDSNRERLNDANDDIVFLSNGFKINKNHAHKNSNNTTYIYGAWAEEPQFSSKGVPATARK